MPRAARLVALIALVVSACQSGGSTSTTPPDFSNATFYQLQARAFASACRAVLCAGTPIYTASGNQDLLDAIAEEFSDEVVPLTEDEIEDMTGPDGRFVDGGTFIAIQQAYMTDRSDVAAVDVWVSRGFLGGEGRTVLFEWNGASWDESTPTNTGITATTAVS